jgi:hypothetical protein
MTCEETPSKPVAQGLAAYVVPAPDTADLRLATLPPDERWVRAFAMERIEGKRLDEAAVGSTLADAHGPVVLASGAYAVDQYAVEAVVEAAPECNKNEVLIPAAPGLSRAPIICLGAEAVRRLAGAGELDLGHGMDRAMDFLEKQEGLHIRTIDMHASFWARVTDSRSAGAATWGLLQRLQYRPGGLVAVHLNRPISIRCSRLIADTAITPNQTTMVAFVVGVLGVAMVLLGNYWWAVAGTFLLHVNSVWDGIDGELARLKYQCSEFGAYLDSVCDEFLNSAIIIAAGFHIVWNLDYPQWWAWLGLFGGIMTFVYALTHWHCKWKHGLGFYWWWEAYKPRKQVQRSTSPWFYFKKLFCKDTILLVFLAAAIFKFMHVLVLAAAIMGAVNLVLLFIHIVILRARW